MTLRQIQYAIEVEKQGSISKAARNLFVSQSTLSFAIKDLERELGLAIFERTPNGMWPTKEGEVFLREARNALTAFNGLEQTISGLRNDSPGLSVITVQSSFIPPVIEKLVARQESDIHSFRLRYKVGNTGDVIDKITNGEFDMGFIYATDYQEQAWKQELSLRGIETEWVCSWQICAIFSKDDPLAGRNDISLPELSEYTFVYGGDDDLTGFSNIVDYNAKNFDLTQHRHYVDAQDALMLNLLMNSPGRFTIGHRAPASIYRDAFAYVPLRDPGEAHLLMIKLKGRSLPSQAKMLMEIIREAVNDKEA